MLSALPALVDTVGRKHPTTAVILRLVGRAARRVVPESSSSLPGPDGVIDFRNRRAMYSHGAFWQLIADGQDYSGHPGEWWVGPADDVSEENPFWLLGLPAATAEVTTETAETIRGVRCRRCDAFADFLPSSYGFRPGLSAHHALETVRTTVNWRETRWVLDADIQAALTKSIRTPFSLRSSGGCAIGGCSSCCGVG
jgi:hypothetical protein